MTRLATSPRPIPPAAATHRRTCSMCARAICHLPSAISHQSPRRAEAGQGRRRRRCAAGVRGLSVRRCVLGVIPAVSVTRGPPMEIDGGRRCGRQTGLGVFWFWVPACRRVFSCVVGKAARPPGRPGSLLDLHYREVVVVANRHHDGGCLALHNHATYF
jgi:hypothetical protein